MRLWESNGIRSQRIIERWVKHTHTSRYFKIVYTSKYSGRGTSFMFWQGGGVPRGRRKMLTWDGVRWRDWELLVGGETGGRDTRAGKLLQCLYLSVSYRKSSDRKSNSCYGILGRLNDRKGSPEENKDPSWGDTPAPSDKWTSGRLRVVPKRWNPGTVYFCATCRHTFTTTLVLKKKEILFTGPHFDNTTYHSQYKCTTSLMFWQKVSPTL